MFPRADRGYNIPRENSFYKGGIDIKILYAAPTVIFLAAIGFIFFVDSGAKTAPRSSAASEKILVKTATDFLNLYFFGGKTYSEENMRRATNMMTKEARAEIRSKPDASAIRTVDSINLEGKNGSSYEFEVSVSEYVGNKTIVKKYELRIDSESGMISSLREK